MTKHKIKNYNQFTGLFNKIDLNKDEVYLIIGNKKSRVICSIFSLIEVIQIKQEILKKNLIIEVLK